MPYAEKGIYIDTCRTFPIEYSHTYSTLTEASWVTRGRP